MLFPENRLLRQLDLIPVKVLGTPITIIGAGAIGSFTALNLAKMGFENITVFDFDRIEEENMNCQFYRVKDIGKSKVKALAQLVKDFTEVKIMAVEEPYEEGTFPGIVISAVDSMKVRKLIWDNHRRVAPHTRAIIDPRMGAEQALLYVMEPMNDTDAESYEKTLYSDENAVQERCTAKATIYTANMLSGLVAKSVKDIVTKSEKTPRVVHWSIKDNHLVAWSRPKVESKILELPRKEPNATETQAVL